MPPLSTSYGEIAIRDIAADEEMTGDDSMFNLPVPMVAGCCGSGCRGVVSATNLDRLAPRWDELLRPAIARCKARQGVA
jgi:hypothetical protein